MGSPSLSICLLYIRLELNHCCHGAQVKLNPLQPVSRGFCGRGKSPFADLADRADETTASLHADCQPVTTEIVALSVPGVNMPAEDPLQVDANESVAGACVILPLCNRILHKHKCLQEP